VEISHLIWASSKQVSTTIKAVSGEREVAGALCSPPVHLQLVDFIGPASKGHGHS